MQLRIDYKNVSDQVNKINEARRTLETQRNRVSIILDNLDGNWQGITASEFKSKLYEFIKELDKAIKEMESLAQDISTVANNIKSTDEQLVKDVTSIIHINGFGGGAGGCIRL